jgi:hypothetical protein
MGKVKLHGAPRPFENAHRHYRSAWNLKKIDTIIKSVPATDGISLQSPSRDTVIPFETLRRWKLKLTKILKCHRKKPSRVSIRASLPTTKKQRLPMKYDRNTSPVINYLRRVISRGSPLIAISRNP